MDYVELDIDLENTSPEVMGRVLSTMIERGYDIVPIVEDCEVVYVID